ncbi:hypothetical protein BCON_0457g00060 [Botryotinia convoluta]|uniref:Uncharacterized protein n=1 Tax=Botryotinia convoluta TaxID=54673 RepID=A0A4Z1H828_9HELO|nr:hypothetical protein BCON_0457g00060 [Botryotinia convoluta]
MKNREQKQHTAFAMAQKLRESFERGFRIKNANQSTSRQTLNNNELFNKIGSQAPFTGDHPRNNKDADFGQGKQKIDESEMQDPPNDARH